jgi:hypothetical protein
MTNKTLDSVVSNAGRPTDYSDELAADICLRIANGRSVNSICTDADMPSKTSIYEWLNKHSQFTDMYREAVNQRADFHFDEMLDIADDVIPETAEVARAKLRIDTRKWVISRMNPRKYGDKADGSEADEDTAQPIEVVVNVRDARKPDTEHGTS